ncbi:MAG: nucleotide exchange factor GrpE [Verrucomicrobia bacterium]|nr:nucleotide exchange factor GrpE [Verrucomicrobiota bacterium]MDA1067471.1 nucleotide exchange factor GrpE [Verrucomicrobiota bacterium]
MKEEEINNTLEEEMETPEGEEAAVESSESEESPITEDTTDDVKELSIEELLEKSRQEKEDLYEKVLRAAADFENFRKRTIREKEELRKFALSGLIEDLLPALDNLELGLMSADNHPEAKAISEGFRMVAQQLGSILQSNGLECVDPVGEVFDPNFHESVAFQPSDEVEDHKIIQVVRKGYSLNGRILRAANVIVSSGPATEEDGES